MVGAQLFGLLPGWHPVLVTRGHGGLVFSSLSFQASGAGPLLSYIIPGMRSWPSCRAAAASDTVKWLRWLPLFNLVTGPRRQ